MLNVIVLSKNYIDYVSGYYHQDLIDSFCKLTNVFLYGPGYSGYNLDDNIDDIISKSPFNKSQIDLIVCSTSWDEDHRTDTVDPHPLINLSKIAGIPKVYFLNKEYKKLPLRFDYIKKQRFDLVCTVCNMAEKWSKEIGIKFFLLPFGISLTRFKDYGLKKKWDFGFTGNLHKNHVDYRYLVKKEIFTHKAIDCFSNYGLSSFMKKNPIRKEYRKYKIFWAEFQAKDLLFRSMLPKGIDYAKFLNTFRMFLNTPSANGIFNTRFFELMATKTLIFCPDVDLYMDILKDGVNCIMFKSDMSNFKEKFVDTLSLDNKNEFYKIIDNAFNHVQHNSYDCRVKTLLEEIGAV